MKAMRLILQILCALIFANIQAQLKVLPDGNVGIKTINPLTSFQINDSYTKTAFGNANSAALHWGTSYIGLNAVRQNNGSWLCSNDGTNNGGSIMFGKLDGTIIFCPINTTGNVSQNLDDASIYSKRILELKGDQSISILPNHWTNGIVIKNDYFLDNFNMVSIYPANDWYGELGTARLRFGGAYIDHIWYGWLTCTSDLNIKENIRDISNVTDKMMKLRPVKFDFKASYYDSVTGDYKNKLLEDRMNRVGLIAQEVRDIFPELVCSDGNNGLLGINYIDFIPYIIQMLKEQQDLIDSLQIVLENCYIKNEFGSKSVNKSNPDVIDNSNLQIIQNVTKLYQNNPNPFSEYSTIKYSLSENIKDASIIICDMQGILLKTYENLNRLSSEIIINGGEFKAGMYLYSMIVDGKEIDTKRMILTK